MGAIPLANYKEVSTTRVCCAIKIWINAILVTGTQHTLVSFANMDYL